MGVSFADYDDDGFMDIFVANDGMQQYLYHNNGNGTFSEVAMESGAALSADGKPLSGMGTVFQDYDNDGRPDILVTELPREIYGLYHNDGGGLFTNLSLETGLGALTAGSAGWGVGLEDLDNDGWKDLLVTQSHVLDNVEAIDKSLHYLQTPLLALNHNGHFERTESGITVPIAGRGLAFGDINNDGWMDAVVTVLGGPPVVLMNRGGKGPLALDFFARNSQQSRRIGCASSRQRADPLCHDLRKLPLCQRQTSSLRLGRREHRFCRSSMAIGYASNAQGCSR